LEHRENEIAFLLAKETLETFFKDSEGNSKPWLFPKVLSITKAWMKECLVLKDNTFPQLLLLTRLGRTASEKIYRSIVSSVDGAKRIQPILRGFENLGDTFHVDFDTTKPVFETAADKCHISHVVADTKSWEQKMAETLESMPEVFSYVKNQNLGFTIPYSFEGEARNYYPDFIAKVTQPGTDEMINLVIEVSGETRKDKAAKVETAQLLWAPAVNNSKLFGSWAFLEVTDPWNGASHIREFLAGRESMNGAKSDG
jgi:type III restriction enzyme